jgi:glutamate-5-semialdehyde dehydrogenase
LAITQGTFSSSLPQLYINGKIAENITACQRKRVEKHGLRAEISRQMNAIESELENIGRKARTAAHRLATLSSTRKNAILQAMAEGLEKAEDEILAANEKDLDEGRKRGLSEAMLDRLRLDAGRLGKMVQGIREVSVLPDPVGEILAEWTRPNGLRIQKVRVPIGVIGIVYESRPNVTSDAGVLCLKAGNAVILRGGSEAFHSNKAIANILEKSGREAGLPDGALQLVPTTDREAVGAMCRMDRWIDVLIPRGGEALIRRVVEEARMPVIKHYNGICHVYLDRAADPKMAREIVLNAKCQRPGVCNALETLLVHRDLAPTVLPDLAKALRAEGVELRGDEAARALCGDTMLPASEEDWRTEYLALVLAVRVVDSLDAAIEHINEFGSRHTDSIVTADEDAARAFLARVDSATVLWNASTRFSDGGEFGFGAEIGISTDKLHARGPMALAELTTYKYLVFGTGQVRN